MRENSLTEVELSRTTVPYKKADDGRLYPVLNAVLQKGTRIHVDAPMEYTNPFTSRVVRLLRFRTHEGPLPLFAHIGNGHFLIEEFTPFTVV